MPDFLLNSNDDLAIVNGDLAFVTDHQTDVRQRVLITLRAWRGEWILNTQFGIPYLQEIFQKVGNQDIVDSFFIDAALAVDGVLEIVNFRSEFDSVRRKYTINSMEIRTTDGPVFVARETPDKYRYPDPVVLQPIVCNIPANQ